MSAAGKIRRYLEDDHARIEDALRRAAASSDGIDAAAYAEFRGALLRHIGMEERILFPAARAAHSGEVLPGVDQLHLDHGALAALLVPTPTRNIVEAIRTILRRHNTIEEGPEGVYDRCEELPGFDVPAVLRQLQAAPPVAMAPHVDSAVALESMRAAVERAGYHFEL